MTTALAVVPPDACEGDGPCGCGCVMVGVIRARAREDWTIAPDPLGRVRLCLACLFGYAAWPQTYAVAFHAACGVAE